MERLAKFDEWLHGFQPEQVRAAAISTFCVIKNIGHFIPEVEVVLGLPIEVIASREETRPIYTGVVHAPPSNSDRTLVIDIGSGSTKFVIGSDSRPTHAEDLSLGCVTCSVYFSQSKVGNKDFQVATAAARSEI